MAGTGAPATDDRGSPFEPVPIRAGVAAEDVLERWAAGSSAARGAARGAPGTTIPSGAQRYWGVPFACATLDGGTAPGWAVAGGAGPATLALDGQDGAGDNPGRGPGYLVLLHVCSPPPATAGGDGEGRTRSWPPSPRAWPGWDATWATTSWSTATGAGTGRPSAGGSRSAGRTAGSARAPSRRGPSARPCRWSSGGPPRGTPGGAGRPPSAGEGAGGHCASTPWRIRTRERPLRALRVEAANGHEIAVAALTRWYGREHPLRHERLESFRVTLPPELVRTPRAGEPSGGLAGDAPPPGTLDLSYVPAEIDLGVIARKYAVPAFDPDAWLGGAGIGAPAARAAAGRAAAGDGARPSASTDATLTVGGRAVPLRAAFEGAGAASRGRRRAGGGAGAAQDLAARHRRGRRHGEAGPLAGCTSGPRTGATSRPTGTGTR